MSAWSPAVLEHFERPRNAGALDPADPDVGTGEVGERAHGDLIRLQVRVRDGRIAEARFKAFGCGVAIAATSLATERLLGLDLAAARALRDVELAAALALPPVKIHCSVLVEAAIRRALEDWERKQAGPAAGGPVNADEEEAPCR